MAQQFEVIPQIGGTFGGSFKVDYQNLPHVQADIGNSANYGVSFGRRFDQEECHDCGIVDFRWMIQPTHLSGQLTNLPSFPTRQPSATLNSLLADFTHEFPIEESATVRPFLTATIGGTILSVPASTEIRFAFGLGTGFRAFPQSRFGLQFRADWLAIVLHAGVQTLVCNVGCVVVLNGGLTSQFVFSIGPIFRFGQ
jgi:hypothetical protein